MSATKSQRNTMHNLRNIPMCKETIPKHHSDSRTSMEKGKFPNEAGSKQAGDLPMSKEQELHVWLFQRAPSLCSRKSVSETVSTKGKQKHRFLCSPSLLCRGRGGSVAVAHIYNSTYQAEGRIADVKPAWTTQQYQS